MLGHGEVVIVSRSQLNCTGEFVTERRQLSRKDVDGDGERQRRKDYEVDRLTACAPGDFVALEAAELRGCEPKEAQSVPHEERVAAKRSIPTVLLNFAEDTLWINSIFVVWIEKSFKLSGSFVGKFG